MNTKLKNPNNGEKKMLELYYGLYLPYNPPAANSTDVQ